MNDLSSAQCCANKSIRFKTSMLRSKLCDYSDACIVVNRRIAVEGDNDDKTRNKKLIFRNDAPFRSCISKISNIFIENAEDIEIVTPT